MKQNALIWLPGIFATILGAMPSAMAGPTLTYVKTLGQSNVKGSPLRTAGSRISVDQDGNLYLCGITNLRVRIGWEAHRREDRARRRIQRAVGAGPVGLRRGSQ
ncbi:MAG: hypothetical protein NTY19_16895 [Planctomycetota bacterium]|nr:hypothetical protein [Planctomycetota bacterium]